VKIDKKGSCLNIRAKGKTLTIEPIKPVADKYFGMGIALTTPFRVLQ
jgi:hypothetical protein